MTRDEGADRAAVRFDSQFSGAVRCSGASFEGAGGGGVSPKEKEKKKEKGRKKRKI